MFRPIGSSSGVNKRMVVKRLQFAFLSMRYLFYNYNLLQLYCYIKNPINIALILYIVKMLLHVVVLLQNPVYYSIERTFKDIKFFIIR
jgi:hypothetical protein